MLRTKSDNSSNWKRTAKAAFRVAIRKPLLVRRCVGVAAALAGLTVMTSNGMARRSCKPPASSPPKRAIGRRLPYSTRSDLQRLHQWIGVAVSMTRKRRAGPACNDWICAGAATLSQREPLVDGAAVPEMFTLRWKLERCAPFAGGELLIDGEITFAVSHDDTGLRAQMVKHTLTAETPTGNRHRAPAIAVLERSAGDSPVANAP